MVASYSSEISRDIRMLSLASYVLAVLFVDAFIYRYVNFDDRILIDFATQHDCESPRTV